MKVFTTKTVQLTDYEKDELKRAADIIDQLEDAGLEGCAPISRDIRDLINCSSIEISCEEET